LVNLSIPLRKEEWLACASRIIYWRCLHHRTFFNVRFFKIPLQPPIDLPAWLLFSADMKLRSVVLTVRKVEHGSFTPLIFSSGVMGKAATTTYKHLAHSVEKSAKYKIFKIS